jgi:trans-aconitate methyltransferase
MKSPDPSPMFTWNPAEYNKFSPVQQLWARELIAKLDLLGFERVIDIGCSDGKVTAAIASTVPEGAVTGIDNSPEMIGFAQQHFAIYPADPDGVIHFGMMWLEVEAKKEV